MVCVAEATVGVTSAKVPPANVFPSTGSVLKIKLLVVAKRFAPLLVAAVCLTWRRPPPTVTVPVKFVVAPKVMVAAASEVVMLLLIVTVEPEIPVTTEPEGILPPLTDSPIAMVPVTVPMTKVFALAAPPEAQGAEPPAR